MLRLVETLRNPPHRAPGRITYRDEEWGRLRERWQAWPAWYSLALLMAAGLWLRIVPWLAAYPLHRDEALYGAWARLIAGGADPWLLTSWVDKPPLVLYLLAGSLAAGGVSDLALRAPAMLASVLTVGATYGLARHIAARPVALLAAGLVACSPFAILFAPTAFTDPWLALWLVLAAWAALARRPFWAGLALGLAVASKQSGILGVPLVLGLCVMRHTSSVIPRCGTLRDPAVRDFASSRTAGLYAKREEARTGAESNGGDWPGRGAWRRFVLPAFWCLLGFALVFGLVYWWDTLRWAKRPSFWDRSLQTYGGIYLAPPAEWSGRAARWAAQAGYLWGTPVLTGAVLLLVGLGTWRAARRGQAAPVVLAAYSLGYLLVHWLVTFQPWDRYLLPLAPLLAILAALGIGDLWQDLPRAWPGRCGRLVVIAVAVLLLVGPGWLGLAGRIPVGSDHYAFTGLDQVVATLQRLPGQSLIYHRSLGWHLDYYLYGRPQQRVWWAEPEILAADAEDVTRGDPGRPQWLAIAWASDAAVVPDTVAALARRGLRLDERERIYRPNGTASFTLYEILPQEQVR